MKPKDIMGLILRIVGLFGIILVVKHWFIIWHHSGTIHWHQPLVLFCEGFLCIMAFYLLLGAPMLMDLIYPEKKKQQPEAPPWQAENK